MWQPIDTAPRDGTEVLLWVKDTPNESGPFAVSGWYFSSPKVIDDGWETAFGSVGEPTHWMPLPNPPTDEKA